MGVEEDLKANIKEFIESADEDFEKGRYNSSIGSYFKAISAICDLEIYKLKRILPKNHSERFFLLKISFNRIYEIVNLLFDKYTKTYNSRLGKKEALLFKENARKIIEIFKE